MIELNPSGGWGPDGGAVTTLLPPASVNSEAARYLARLEPAPDEWMRRGTGAVLLIDDPRDYHPSDHPRVAKFLPPAVPPPAFDRSQSMFEIYDQGATSACVPTSSCGAVALDNNADRHVRYSFLADSFYRELGGTGPNGIDTRQTLSRLVDVGAPLREGGRIKIGSYFRCDSIPGQFETQVKAALAANQIVVLAMLLPSTWGGKWTPGTTTAGYHQVIVSGYDGDLFWGPNSWSSRWPGADAVHGAGFYECSFAYVVKDGFQSGHCYAFFFDPYEVHSPVPTPPTPTPTPPVPSPVPTPTDAFEAKILELCNNERRQAGLQVLQLYGPAQKAAHDYARTMAQTNHYDHHGQDGSQALQRMFAAGMDPTAWSAWGENIAAGQSTPEGVHRDWMASPGHRANLMMPGFTHVGMGYCNLPGSLYVNWWVQNFVALKSGPGPQPPIPTPTPPVPTPTPPSQVTVTGYQPSPVGAGQTFIILGTGFFSGVVSARWGNIALTVSRISTEVIQAEAPVITTTRTEVVTVQVEGQTAVGPPLTVTFGSGPTPPVPTPNPPVPTPVPPTPVDSKTVTGAARGSGLETLVVGGLLAATGTGFSGTITLTAVQDGDTGPQPPVPTPEPPVPEPGPEPPTPTPTDLVPHHVGPQRGGIWFWVSDANQTTVPATIKMTAADGTVLQGQTHSGPGSASFVIGGHHGLASIDVKCDDGRTALFEGPNGLVI